MHKSYVLQAMYLDMSEVCMQKLCALLPCLNGPHGGRWAFCVYAPLPDALTEGTWLVVPLLDCFRKEESYSIITRPTAS